MRPLNWWGIPRRGWILILSELFVIVGLSGWVISEYLNNVYFQTYVNSLTPILVPLFSVAFGVASASAATILYFSAKNLRRAEDAAPEEESKLRPQKRTARRTSSSDSKIGKSVSGYVGQTSKLRPFGVGVTSPRKENPSPSRVDDEEKSE